MKINYSEGTIKKGVYTLKMWYGSDQVEIIKNKKTVGYIDKYECWDKFGIDLTGEDAYGETLWNKLTR